MMATVCALVELVLPFFKGPWHEIGIVGCWTVARQHPFAVTILPTKSHRLNSARLDFVCENFQVSARFRSYHVQDEANADSTHHTGAVLSHERERLIADKTIHRGNRRGRL